MVAALDRYGRNLGIAFQIADDVLDIWGEEGATGKSLGTDLEKQKLTLPVIRLLSVADPASALRIRRLLSDAKPRVEGAAAAAISIEPGRLITPGSLPSSTCGLPF